MTEHLLDVALYTGQKLQSETFRSRYHALVAAEQLRSCTMIEYIDVISVSTGEVVKVYDGLSVVAGSPRPLWPVGPDRTTGSL